MKMLGWVLALCAAAAQVFAEDLHERAMRLHRSAIVVDTHEDVPERLQKEWVDLAVRGKTGHVDIPRWREGGVTAPFLAAYVSADFAKSGGAAKKALEFVDLIHRLVEAHPMDLAFADSVTGIRQAKRDRKIAVLIGIEGGHAIEDSLGALSAYYRLGVRYMTLTHTNSNDWADSSGSFFGPGLYEPKQYAAHDGLTEHGREVVLEMNRLGMLVDVSHVSDKTMADAIAVSKAPVFASHSSCRALSNLPRNVTDAQIKSIAAAGGVVMVNVSSLFLDQKSVDAYVAAKTALQPRIAAARVELKDDPKKRDEEIAQADGHGPLSGRRLDPRGRPHRAGHEGGRAEGGRPWHRLRRHRGPSRPGSRTSRSCPGSPRSCCAAATPTRRSWGSSGRTSWPSGTGSRRPGRPCRRGRSPCRSRSPKAGKR